jgi:hypothetical protein
LTRFFVDQTAQLAQKVGTKTGAPLAGCYHWVGRMDVCPFDGQRAKTSSLVQVRHSVPTPVVTNGENFEGLTFQWMKRMRDRKNFCVIFATLCNARLLPKPR